MKKGLIFVNGWPSFDWLRKAVLSKWFGYGLVGWCAGWLWYEAWNHYKWACLVQVACLLGASWGLYNNGYSEALKWSNKELDKLIERTKNRIAVATEPKKDKDTWVV